MGVVSALFARAPPRCAVFSPALQPFSPAADRDTGAREKEDLEDLEDLEVGVTGRKRERCQCRDCFACSTQ
eukprot:2457938-Rhodomonas_salina.1